MVRDELPSVSDAILTLANSPKVALASSGGGLGIGYLAKENLEAINSLLATATMAVSFITGTVVCAVWIVKFIRYWRDTAIEPKQ